MKLICIEICLCKGLRCHLPLPHLIELFLFGAYLSSFSVFYLLLVPINIIRLLHNNLYSSSSHVQLVVNCVKELGLGVNANFLATLSRKRSAQLLLESILAAHATTSS